MKTRILICMAAAVLCAFTATAQRSAKKNAKSAKDIANEKMDERVRISQMPSIGQQSLIMAPAIMAQGSQPISKTQRRWGVYEMTYSTGRRWTEDLTVGWHVLVDTKNAKQKDRSKTAARIPPYVYYTLTTRYINIPDGDHRSCVCLPPSFIERYGEPAVISCQLLSSEGQLLEGETVVNGVQGIFAGKFSETTREKMEWWNQDSVINAKDKKTGDPLIEIRQGMVDRSKSPFYLVNNADYEVIQ